MLRNKQPKVALLALCALGFLCIGAGPAFAANDAGTSGAQSDAQTGGGKTETVPGMNPNQSLTEQLDQNKGVITPPPTGDSGIQTTVPDPNPGTTPVIPPPGSPGGNPNVQPK